MGIVIARCITIVFADACSVVIIRLRAIATGAGRGAVNSVCSTRRLRGSSNDYDVLSRSGMGNVRWVSVALVGGTIGGSMSEVNATNKTHKERMLEALEHTWGVVATAAQQAGIHRATHYRWMETDAEYKAAVESIANVALDEAESALHKLIKNGNVAAIIFYLKTQGKQRGYVERQEIELPRKKDFSELSDEELMELRAQSGKGK